MGFLGCFFLVNLRFLAGLVLPIFTFSYVKFWDFLWPPLLFSLVVSSVLLIIILLAAPRLRGRFELFLFNGILVASLLFSAEFYKSHRIAEALKNRKPECLVIQSFLTSLMHARQDQHWGSRTPTLRKTVRRFIGATLR